MLLRTQSDGLAKLIIAIALLSTLSGKVSLAITLPFSSSFSQRSVILMRALIAKVLVLVMARVFGVSVHGVQSDGLSNVSVKEVVATPSLKSLSKDSV